MRKRILVVVTLTVVLFAVSSPGWAAPQFQARSVVTHPTDGMTVGGVVDITGIATHPNINSYEVYYATGPQPTADTQWINIAIVEGTQVENGLLTTWDTFALPNGQYTLALAVWGRDDAASPYLFFVRQLTVDNSQVVPTPTPVPPTPEPLPTAVVGPTSTPVTIQQPATPTPRPSPTPQDEATEGAGASSVDEEEGFSLPLDFSLLRTAFYAGGLVTVTLFLLWGLYILVKAGLRWFLRQRTRSPWE